MWPALAIGLTTGAFVLLGNAVRDALEDRREVPKAKQAEGRRGARQATVAASAPGEITCSRCRISSVGYPRADGSVKLVVDDVSFHVDRGEVLAIVGESGSGKTQTAFSILGLLPDAARIVGGSIRFDGVSTVEPGDQVVAQARLTPLRGRRISYIPQEPMSNLDPAFTIGYQLVRPMVRVLGISKAEARTRALDLLAKVGIPDPRRTFDAYPHEVSGGMAQRVLIAGAVSCEPDLVIADEPTTALDVTVQAEVLDLLREMQAELGVGDRPRHPQLRRRGRPGRPGGRHAERPDRRGRAGARDAALAAGTATPRRCLGSMLAEKEPLTAARPRRMLTKDV